jgi:hypothetical protein
MTLSEPPLLEHLRRRSQAAPTLTALQPSAATPGVTAHRIAKILIGHNGAGSATHLIVMPRVSHM